MMLKLYHLFLGAKFVNLTIYELVSLHMFRKLDFHITIRVVHIYLNHTDISRIEICLILMGFEI